MGIDSTLPNEKTPVLRVSKSNEDPLLNARDVKKYNFSNWDYPEL